MQLNVYDDCIVIIRPLWPFPFKTIIPYDQVEHIRDLDLGKSFVTYDAMDLFLYIKGKKRPITIPMPSSKEQRARFKEVIATNGISAEWGIYE